MIFKSPITKICAFCSIIFVWGATPVNSAIHVRETGNLYRVTGVPVDITAKSAVQAKELAIRKGQDLAFQVLLKKILTPEKYRAANQLRSEDFLEDFEILSQKFSNRRFIGKAAYNFSKPLLKSKLDTPKLLSAETPPVSYVVIPVLIDDGNVKLWSDNPWLQAWAHSTSRRENISIITPLGDLNDVIALKPSDAITLQKSLIHNFIHKYKARGGIVAIYRAPDVVVHVFQDGQHEVLKVPGVPLLDSQNPEYQNLIHPILTALERHLKQHSHQQNVSREIKAHLAAKTLRDLLYMQNTLKKITLIEDFTTHIMSTEQTQINLKFKGSIESLRFSLQTNGLYIAQDQQGEWWITKAKVL